MTIGLAMWHESEILFAIDGSGVPECGTSGKVIGSKLVVVQTIPKVVMIVGGGLAHWAEVLNDYKTQPDLGSAATELRRLLTAKTQLGNRAFARVCGFAGASAQLVRIDREKGDAGVSSSGVVAWSRDEPEVIGVRPDAAAHVRSLTTWGCDPLRAMVVAIQERVDDVDVRLPVHVQSFQCPT